MKRNQEQLSKYKFLKAAKYVSQTKTYEKEYLYALIFIHHFSIVYI